MEKGLRRAMEMGCEVERQAFEGLLFEFSSEACVQMTMMSP